MAAPAFLLLALLLSSPQGDPDVVGRRLWHQVSRQRGHLCSLGTCQTHRLQEIIYWLRATSTKEPSGKAGREPRDPLGYGRRRRRAVRAQLRPQESHLRQRSQGHA